MDQSSESPYGAEGFELLRLEELEGEMLTVDSSD